MRKHYGKIILTIQALIFVIDSNDKKELMILMVLVFLLRIRFGYVRRTIKRNTKLSYEIFKQISILKQLLCNLEDIIQIIYENLPEAMHIWRIMDVTFIIDLGLYNHVVQLMRWII